MATRVLLLDTNVSSSPIHQYLEAEGYEVHVVGRNPNDFLARTAAHYIELDYADVGATLDLAERLDARYLVPGCNDLSYQTCSEISARRPYPGVDSAPVTRTINNKQAFRDYARGAGIPAPQVIADESSVPDRPVIVKPVDAYSGRGVTALTAPCADSLSAAVALAKAFSASGEYILEDLVEGQLYSHSAFLDPAGIVADFIVEEHGSVSPFTVDTSRVEFDFAPPMLGRVRAAISTMARDLGLRSGLIHTQFIAKDDRFWIIEVTRRCPGDLYSLLISLSTDFNYVENYVRPFIGRPFAGAAQGKTAIMRHTLALGEERSFEAIRFHRPLHIERFVPLAVSGDRLKPSPFGRLGIIFARTAPGAELDDLMRATLAGELYSVLG